jgi:hypothetical protein
MEAIQLVTFLLKYKMFSVIFLIHPCLSCDFFNCEDSSRVIPSSFVNDDFCDCPDGSDERKTSACPSAVFQCPGIEIPSSRVKDGICGS